MAAWRYGISLLVLKNISELACGQALLFVLSEMGLARTCERAAKPRELAQLKAQHVIFSHVKIVGPFIRGKIRHVLHKTRLK